MTVQVKPVIVRGGALHKGGGQRLEVGCEQLPHDVFKAVDGTERRGRRCGELTHKLWWARTWLTRQAAFLVFFLYLAGKAASVLGRQGVLAGCAVERVHQINLAAWIAAQRKHAELAGGLATWRTWV